MQEAADDSGMELTIEQQNAINTDRWTSFIFFFISFITAFFGITLLKFRDHLLPKEERESSFTPVSVSIGGGGAQNVAATSA